LRLILIARFYKRGESFLWRKTKFQGSKYNNKTPYSVIILLIEFFWSLLGKFSLLTTSQPQIHRNRNSIPISVKKSHKNKHSFGQKSHVFMCWALKRLQCLKFRCYLFFAYAYPLLSCMKRRWFWEPGVNILTD